MEAQPALIDRRLKGLFAWGCAWYKILIEVTDKFSKDDVHQRQSLEAVSHPYRKGIEFSNIQLRIPWRI
jgi:hypothetical protein